MSIEIIVVGTNEYNWALKPYLYLMDKHWPEARPVFYGDRPAMRVPGLEMRRCPAYPDEWPWAHWFGEGLRSVLRDLGGDVVCLTLPDHWLSARADHKGVLALKRYMERHPTVMRGELTAGTCLDQHGRKVRDWWGREVVSVAPTDHHCSFGGGLSFSPALWNREAFISILEPGWDLWACEKAGTDKFAREWWPEWTSVGLRPAPLRRCHGLGHGRPGTASLEGLSAEDAEAVRKMLPPEWRARA